MRDGDAQVIAASGGEVVRPVLLSALDWPSGMVRLTSAPFNVTWGGNTYLGVGDLGEISRVEEGPETKSYGITLALSGIRPEYLNEVTTSPVQGRSCRLWFGMLDDSHQLIGDPLEIFGGRMDVATVEMGATCTITVSAESRLVDWERPRVRRYTHEDQQAAFPGDRGLEFVVGMIEVELLWGRTL